MEKQEEFNGQIKAIFRGGKIHKINWGANAKSDDVSGHAWNTWSTEHKLEYAMELASAMNQAADIMQNERNALLEKNEIAKRSVEFAEQALTVQKKIMTTQLLAGNEQTQQLSAQIQKLQTDLRARDKTIEDLRR